MRPHGTKARYVFGPEGSDTSQGCRCEECRTAVREYERERLRRTEPAYVAASRAREHVAWLSTQGVGLKQIVKVSGVSQGALWKLMYGKDGKRSKRIRRSTEERLLAVTPSDGAEGSKIPSGPTWEVVERLLSRGWTKAAIARAIGNQRALQIGAHEVRRGTAAKIEALLDQPVPADVGLAWSAHHQANAGPEPEPEAVEDRTDPILALAEMLEARIDQRWRSRAACRMPDVPTWIFFPSRGDNATMEAAKQVCRTCPVAAECLNAHLGEQEGVYGGLSGRERRRLREEVAA